MGSSVFAIRNHPLLLLRLFSIFLCFSSTFFQQTSFAQGRQISDSNVVDNYKQEGEEKVMRIRELIGSRPPRCEGRCNNCGHCEAIQVPIVPQQGFPRNHFVRVRSSATPTVIAYSRGDNLSNYKPMSWKCKCGHSIFNP